MGRDKRRTAGQWGRRILAGILSAALAAVPVPEAKAEDTAELNGIRVWIQWASGSSADILNWNASREEEKTLTIQVNYRSSRGESWTEIPAGAIRIRVPGIGMACRDMVKRADGAGSSSGESLWDHTYDPASDTYLFTNRSAIAGETSFAGAFQIAWHMNSRELVNGYGQKIRAVLEMEGRTAETNELQFSFSSKADVFQLEAAPNALEGPDGLGENAGSFYWVRYGIKETIGEKSRAAEGKYYTVELPEGAELKRVGEGEFEDLGDGCYRFPYKPYQNVYVAYPKDRFGGEEIWQTFRLFGTYLDTDRETELAWAETAVTPNDYGFVYNGNLYWVGKGGFGGDGTEEICTDRLYEGQILKYTLMAVARHPDQAAAQKRPALSAFYPGATASEWTGATESEWTEETATPSSARRASPSETEGDWILEEDEEPESRQRILRAAGGGRFMDLYLCDDFLDITGPDGSFRQLEDEEYEMVDVTIPSFRSFTNANGFPVESGKYRAEIVLGTDRHGEAAASFPINEDFHLYTFPPGTNRFFIRIRNVDESLYISQFDLEVTIKFHLDPDRPVMDGGVLRNNDGLIVEYGGVHHNTVFDDSYLGSDRERVRQRDLDTYGIPVQRWYYDYSYASDLVSHNISVSAGELKGGEKGYGGKLNILSAFYRGENLGAWSFYSLLPEGMDVDRELLEAADPQFRGFLDEFGSAVSEKVLREGFSLLVTEDFRGTGRTLLEGRFRYGDDPVSCAEDPASVLIEIPVLVSFEALEKFGSSYLIGAEQILSGRKKGSAYGTGKNGVDDGSSFGDEAWKDIDENGDTGQELVFGSCAANIIHVMDTQLELKKTVSTPRTYGEYRTNAGEDGSFHELWAYFGHEYRYRLNLRNTGTPASHVVLYEELENSTAQDGEKSEWRGTLQQVDVSRAEELGLQPTVWYSEERKPGTLESGAWKKGQPDNPDRVKAVAVSFGAERMKTAQDVWVDLLMTAPPEQEELTGKRTVNSFSAAFQAAGQSETLESNPVSIKLDYPKGTVAIEKKDAVSGERLSGYEFELLDGQGNRAALIMDGTMTPEDVRTGTYTLRELKAPEGYERALDRTVTIEAGLNRIPVEEPRIPGRAVLIKTDASDHSIVLEGAEFRLFREDGALVRDNLVTDRQGKLTVEDLEWGTYYLEEIKAPDGHYLHGSRKTYFTVGAKATVTELEAENRSYGKAVLIKYDRDQPGKTVPGAEYDLYTENGLLLRTLETDENGRAEADGLEWGTYYFQERKAAPGYEISHERMEFTVYRDNALSEIMIHTDDAEQTASVKLIKVDKEDGNLRLPGAVYTLRRKTEDGWMDMGIYRTDSKGEITVRNLKFGEYVLKEIAAPQGYSLEEENQAEFVLDSDTVGLTISLRQENQRKKGALQLKKVDEDHVPVEGAVFDLYRGEELYRKDLVTDSYGLIQVGTRNEPVLEWGEYTLKETKVPEGYEATEGEWTFVIDQAHVQNPVTVTAVNRRKKGSVKLIKYRKGDPDHRIYGAEYGLYTEEGVCLQKQTTDETGEAVFEEIPWGTYYLQEVSAPEPYARSEEKLRFSVNRDNCGFLQILEAEDDVRRTSLTIRKVIGEEDRYDAYGIPSFLYRIEGRDGAGKYHVWYRQIILGEGETEGSVSLENIEASDADGYRITELDTVRYELEAIQGTNIRDASLPSASVTADLYDSGESEAVFFNRLSRWEKYSHTANAVNLVKKQRSLTYLDVNYTGPGDVTEFFRDGRLPLAGNREFLEKYLTVTAYYDSEDRDGNMSRELSWNEYQIEPESLEGHGTAAPDFYLIEISFEENGIERKGSFQVEAAAERAMYTICYRNPSGKDTEPVREMAKYGTTELLIPQTPPGYRFGGWYEKEDFSGVHYGPGSEFINSDREEIIFYGKWIPISYSVDYRTEGGTLSGQQTSYTIESETFALPEPVREGYLFEGWTGSNGGVPEKQVQVEKGSMGDRVFTAHWTPRSYSISYILNGGTVTGQRTSYNIETADFVLPQPSKEGYRFKGWTGSNGTVPQTQVVIPKGSMGNRSYEANWQELYGLLMEGPDFNGALKRLSTGAVSGIGTPNSVIRGIRTASSVPAGEKTAVVSDSSSPAVIRAYFEEESGMVYLVCETEDLRLSAGCQYMFANFNGLEYLDLGIFDTSGVTNMSNMFNRCSALTGVNLKKTDTSSVISMSRMFAECSSLTSLDLSSFRTEKVKAMYEMFYNDGNLTSVHYGSGFVYPLSCDTGFMYYKCPAPKPSWDGSWSPRGEFLPG